MNKTSKLTIQDFAPGDSVHYLGTYDDFEESGVVDDVDVDLNLLLVTTDDGEYREWDPHTCVKV